MRRICSWCGSLLHQLDESGTPVSHSLCGGCLEDLQAGLANEGLSTASAARDPFRSSRAVRST